MCFLRGQRTLLSERRPRLFDLLSKLRSVLHQLIIFICRDEGSISQITVHVDERIARISCRRAVSECDCARYEVANVNVPDGHGHRYVGDVADTWATVLQPPGRTAEKNARLRPMLPSE